MNYKKWLALFLALVVVVLVSAILPNKATEVEAQGLDLNRHCQQHGRERAVNIDGTAYGWRCEDSQGQLHPMSIQDACNEQYGSGYTAQFSNMNDQNSWTCVAQSQPVNPTSVPPVNPPPSNPQTDQVRHEGIDLARYCQDKGLGTIVLIGTHARDWRCQNGNTYSGLNLQEACLMQHGLPHVGLLSDDPYGWFCSSQPETLVDGPESPLPGQSQSSQPTVADPGPAHGNQASDTRTSSGGCAIQSFTMTPQGPYVFGQHVTLEVRSTCGTVKFSVDGLDKAEIGSTSQVETWKTNETGVGTIHVCALGRGDGGWSNAAYICYNVYVGPQHRVDAYRPGSNNTGGSSSSGDTACPSSPSRLSVGLLAVVNSNSVNVRNSAGLSAGTLRSINRGQVVSVISGPQCRDGYRWWEIGTDGWSGWSAEVGSNGDYLLLPNGAPLSPSVGSENNSQNQSSSGSSSSGSSGQTSSGSTLPGRNPTCSGAITPHMQVGMRGRVTYTDGSPTNLRDQPGGITRMAMPEGYEFIVVGGPTCHNNLNWWQLRTNDGTTGWSAEGRDGVYWIEPWENNNSSNSSGSSSPRDPISQFDLGPSCTAVGSAQLTGPTAVAGCLSSALDERTTQEDIWNAGQILWDCGAVQTVNFGVFLGLLQSGFDPASAALEAFDSQSTSDCANDLIELFGS